MASSFSKVFNYVITFILIILGILFVMAAPVDSSRATTRLITGIVLIVSGIIFFAVFSLVIERRKYNVVKLKGEKDADQKKYYPKEIICKNCNQKIELSDLLKEQIEKQDTVYCENCGEAVKIDHLGVNW